MRSAPHFSSPKMIWAADFPFPLDLHQVRCRAKAILLGAPYRGSLSYMIGERLGHDFWARKLSIRILRQGNTSFLLFAELHLDLGLPGAPTSELPGRSVGDIYPHSHEVDTTLLHGRRSAQMLDASPRFLITRLTPLFCSNDPAIKREQVLNRSVKLVYRVA